MGDRAARAAKASMMGDRAARAAKAAIMKGGTSGRQGSRGSERNDLDRKQG